MNDQNRYLLKDFLTYRDMLRNCVENNLDLVFLNDSRVHAVMVMTALLTMLAASKGDKTLRMFCGKLSHFRDKTGERIENLKKEMKAHDSQSTDKQWEEFTPFKDLLEALSTFFEKDGRLELVVSSNLDDIKKDECYALFGSAIKDGKMQVWHFDNHYNLDHFSVAGNAFRMENSDEDKTALCCFNDADTATVLNTTFNNLKALSTPLNIA